MIPEGAHGGDDGSAAYVSGDQRHATPIGNSRGGSFAGFGVGIVTGCGVSWLGSRAGASGGWCRGSGVGAF
jgi:hypothetical protein